MTLSWMSSVDDGQVLTATVFEALVQAKAGKYVERGCKVEAAGGMDVKVNSGVIVYNGVKYNVPATTITIEAAESDRDRIDVVVWDYNSGSPAVKVLKGYRWIEKDGVYYPQTSRITDEQIPLALVYVPAGATEITDIRDVRVTRWSDVEDKYGMLKEEKRKLYFGKVENDFAQYFGGILAFPSSAIVYEANEHGVITLKPFAKVQGKDGELALYSPISSAHATMPNHRDLEPSGWMGFFGDDYLKIAYNATLDITDGITVIALVKFDEKDKAQYISKKGECWEFYVAGNNKLTVFLRSGGTWYGAYESASTITTDEYIWVAFTWSTASGVVRFYINGSLDAEVSAITTELATDTSDLHIAVDVALQYYLQGKIAYYFLYNKELSATDVAKVVERPDNPPTDGLIVWLKPDTIDEVNGQWKDASGNGNDGTIHGAVGCVPSELTYLEDAYRLQAGKLDAQYERKEWWFKVGEDILPGKYKLVFRVKDTNNVADDVKVTITNVNDGTVLYEKTFTLSGSDWQLIETEPIDLSAITNKWVEVRIEKATADENTIYVDYVTLDPYGWTPEIYYEVPDEDRHIGEVKVWDTMGSDDESQWVRVFNKEHRFVGDCVVENGVIRVKISMNKMLHLFVWDSDSASWIDTGVFMDDNYSISSFNIRQISTDAVIVDIAQHNREYTLLVGKHGIYIDRITTYTDYNIGSMVLAYAPISHLGHRYMVDFSVNSANYIVGINNTSKIVAGFINSYAVKVDYVYKDMESFKPRFAFAQCEQYVMNLFKEAENAILSTAPDPLTYTDDFSSDTSARYMDHSTDGWTWDTANGVVRKNVPTSVSSEVGVLLVLRSLRFSDGTYKVKIKLGDTYNLGGIAVKWDHLTKSGYVAKIASGAVRLYRVDNGTYNLLAEQTGLSFDENVFNELEVSVDASGNWSVKVNGTEYLTATDNTYSDGRVGLYVEIADNATAGIEFDDLSITAHEIVGRGAQVNRFIDDFDWDSSAEYSGDTTGDASTGFEWDTINSVVKIATNDKQITLNALKFGSGIYRVRVSPKTISDNLYAHILFGRQEQSSGNANTNGSGYLVLLYLHGNAVEIRRVDNGSSVSLATASYTFNAGDWYDVEVQWDTSTGDISVSINGAQVVSANDTTYSSGYAGVGMGGNAAGDEVWFDDLEINAEEVTSSNNTCVILGGVNHGGIPYWFDRVFINRTVGIDIPLGRYLVVVRIKSTANADISYYIRNTTNLSVVTIDGITTNKRLNLNSKDYIYEVRAVELNTDDDRDTLYIALQEVDLWDIINPAIAVDYFLLIPISGLESETLMPQDIAVRSMVHTEYVDDAVDKAFDVRDEVVYVKKPIEELEARKVNVQDGRVDKLKIGYVSGDYGADWSGFDASTVLTNYAEDGAMVLVVNTNTNASPRMKLYAYHSSVGWEEV